MQNQFETTEDSHSFSSMDLFENLELRINENKSLKIERVPNNDENKV